MNKLYAKTRFMALFLVLSMILAMSSFTFTACGSASQGGGATQGAATAAATTAAATKAAATTTAAATTAAQAAATTTKAAATTMAAATTTAAAGSAGSAGAGGGWDELYEITIVSPNAPPTAKPGLVAEYIKDRFGIVVNRVQFQGDAQEIQMMQLASKDYGEVQRMEYDRIYKAYYSAGVLKSLDPYIDKLQDFQRVFADAIPFWRLGADGDLVRWDTNVPRRGDTDIEVNDMLVRTDVLEHYGWPTLVSEDDWVDFLKQALIDFPTTEDGMKTLGVVVPFAQSWGLSSLATINYEKGDQFTELSNVDGGVLFDMKKDKFVDYLKEPCVKECFAFFNRLYREGLLDVECMTDDLAAVEEKLSSGAAIACYYCVWPAWTVNQNLAGLGRENMAYINMPLQSNTQVAEGQKRAIRVEDTRIFDSWGITDNCKHPERIIDFINWACSDEGQIIIQCGLEGEQWVRDASGKRVFTEIGELQFTDKAESDRVGRNPIPFEPSFTILLSDGQFPNPNSHSENADKLLMPRVREAYQKMGWSSSKSWWVENGFFAGTGLPGAISIDASDPLTDVSNKMFELRVKNTASMILAETPEEFERLYNNTVAEHEKLNPQAVVDKYNELYQIEKAKMK